MNPFININNYEEAAMRTAKDMGSIKMNLIHAALGLTSDAGEFATAVKSYAVYNKPLNPEIRKEGEQTLEENMIEELGDSLWFIALACEVLGTSMGAVMRANIEKLAKRYPDKYSDEAAIARADKGEEVNVKQAINELRGTNPTVVIINDIKNKHQEQTATQHNNLQRIMNEAGDVLYFVSPKQMDASNFKYCYGPFSNLETAQSFIQGDTQKVGTVIHKGTEAWSEWFLKAGWVPA